MIVILVNSLQPASIPLDLDAEIQLQTAISKDAEGGRTGRARAVVFSSIPSLSLSMPEKMPRIASQ